MISFIEFNNIGLINDEAKISVDSAGATAYTIEAGKKGISFQNTGSSIVWYGGSTVDPANVRGNKLFPNQSLVYKNVSNRFVIYFKCEAGDSSTISPVNHD